MNNTAYQELPGISSHWLKDLLVSPAHCYRMHLDPLRPEPKASAAMRLGTLVHSLVLTPLQFGEEFTLETLPRQLQARHARQAHLAEQGLTAITPAEFAHAQAIVSALKADPGARRLLTGGQKEQTLIQDRAPDLLPLKARLDIHHPQSRQVVELKTIHSLDAIDTAMTRYRYPLSAAFYADLSQAHAVWFVFVATREPYPVAVFDLPHADLQDGRAQYQTALRRFDACWQTGNWPDAEPAAAPDDDPLMMPMPFMANATKRTRFEVPGGELAL